MQGAEQKSENTSAEQRPSPKAVVLVKFLPHFITAIIGLIALADLLEKYGPSATKMIDHIIQQLQTFSPFEVHHSFISSKSPSFYDYIYSIWNLYGIPQIIRAISSGILGIVIAIGSFGLYYLVVSAMNKEKGIKRGLLWYLAGFPFWFWLYSILFKAILGITLSLFGAFLSIATALVCSLAGIFLGVKVLAGPLEIYHGAHATREVAKAMKDISKGS